MADQWQSTAEHAPEAAGAGWQSTGDHSADMGTDLSGFAGNVARSGAGVIKGAATTLLHPLDTVSGLAAIPLGIMEKHGAGLPDNQGEHARQLDSIMQHYANRYGSWKGFTNAMYEDPIGVLSDLSVVLGGAGSAAEAVNAGRLAKGLNAASEVTDPLRVVGSAVGAISNSARGPVQNMAERLYQTSLKPPPGKTIQDIGDIKDIIRTGIGESIPVTEGGVAKLGGKIDATNKQISDIIKGGEARGVTIDPRLVSARVGDVENKFSNQVNPEPDLTIIRGAKQQFLNRNSETAPYTKIAPGVDEEAGHFVPVGEGQIITPVPIPASEAQSLKQGTYQQLRGQYGVMKNADVEAQKALARGLKEELVKQFPELADLNARDTRLYALDDALQRAVKRIGNRELLPIGDITVSALKSVIDSPTVKSYLAIALDHATRGKLPDLQISGKSIPRMALIKSRIDNYVANLDKTDRGEP